MRSQHIDTAAAIHALFIRLIPCSLRNVNHAGHDTNCETARQNQRAAFIKDFHIIAIFDTAQRGINGVNENPLWKGFFQPVIIVVRGMDAVECVMSDGLKRILVHCQTPKAAKHSG